jgi:hypothetical protein
MRSLRGSPRLMDFESPGFELSSLDLHCVLELHVGQLAPVAGGVDVGLADLEELGDLRDGEETVVRDRVEEASGRSRNWRQSSVSSGPAFRSIS